MTGLFARLFSKGREVSPLDHPRQMAAWCEQLEWAAPQTQHDRIAAVVDEFLSNNRPLHPEQLPALLLLDECAQSGFERMGDQYVSNPRMPREIEQKLWYDVTGLAHSLVLAYQRFISAAAEEGGEKAYTPMLPLLLARSLRYVAMLAKWHYFRFDHAPAWLWALAHSLYRQSEIHGIAANAFPLYPHPGAIVSSCSDEYLRLLMLNTIAASNLSVRQLDGTDQWLAQQTGTMQLARHCDAEHHHYCVNLADQQGPQKIGESRHELYRYWGIAGLLNVAQALIDKLEAGATLQSLGLDTDYPAPACLALLKHLAGVWSMVMHSAQVARSDRHALSKQADVVYGLEQLCRHVRTDNDRLSHQAAATPHEVDYDEVLDMRLYGFISARTRARQAQTPRPTSRLEEVDWQSWRIEDESTDGYGAVVEAQDAQWLHPGVLLGVRCGREENWKVCVARRLARVNESQLHTGIQLLSATPVAAHIHRSPAPGGKAGAAPTTPATSPALYLRHEAAGISTDTLLLYCADYASGQLYDIQMPDRQLTARLGDVLEQGVDWAWVRVEGVVQNH